ncbi:MULTISPECIES: GNAT family N-acetyltransferase [Rhodomicrobium]|uniref:GNAT family N-acetyltransferase n=1 Tax=Rhodomicrobium TaxID=1068 RepID=UPI000B4B7FD9|nr:MULTISPECIES: GNAT family N-acetyltransferase [Rhodomicrobium]
MIVPAVTPGEKGLLVEYLAVKLGTTANRLVGNMPYEVIAVVKAGIGVGAVLYTNYRETSIEISLAGDPGWVGRHDLKIIFSYPFIQLGVLRLNACIRRDNHASRYFAHKLGGREVGVLENEYGHGIDGILYTMTPERCRWINSSEMNGYRPHGKTKRSQAA